MKTKHPMPNLRDLELFDSCVTLGRFIGECISSAEELILVMDRYCISEALVHEYHARGLHPIEHGNYRLLDMIKDEPRLHPVWVLEAVNEPGRKANELMVNKMLEAGVKITRLRLNSKGMLSWLWEDLCSVLEMHRIPCFFDFGTKDTTVGELTDQGADVVRVIAERHPNLPIILSHVMGGLGVHPAVSYLVRGLPNLFIDITGILEFWRTAALEVSPDRVLFATGMPFTDPGILISNIQYESQLDGEAKKLICGDNLRRLLGGVI